MPECCEPECKTPYTMHYHHESIRWNLCTLLRTCVWVSSTNDPCSLVTPLTAWQHGHVLFSTWPYAMREDRVLYSIVTAMGRPGTAKRSRRETPKIQAWIIQLMPPLEPEPLISEIPASCIHIHWAGDCCQNRIFYTTILRQWAESIVNNIIWGRVIVRVIVALLKENLFTTLSAHWRVIVL